MCEIHEASCSMFCGLNFIEWQEHVHVAESVLLCGAWGSHSGGCEALLTCGVWCCVTRWKSTDIFDKHVSALKMSVNLYRTVWCHTAFIISHLYVMFVWWCVHTLWSMYVGVYWYRVYIWAMALDLACELSMRRSMTRRSGQWLQQHYGAMPFN